MPSQRVEQTLERLAEDESLYGDLDDAGAEALRGWLEQQVAAADSGPSFDAKITAIRQAARAAARSGALDPVAAAQAALAGNGSSPGPSDTRSAAERRRVAAARLLGPAEPAAPSAATALLDPPAQVARPAVPGAARRFIARVYAVPEQRAATAPVEASAPDDSAAAATAAPEKATADAGAQQAGRARRRRSRRRKRKGR